ncbi:wsc domain-containing protein [Colletotrichum truncatum]|uniref:Wsc domain-containing protein n=1 Tax=Colletotrichum truncatum TaxID=5467 RepID=A0ACC3YU84_COLTU|nr:wsc domain-containing protein [Colletotrichum truncatum]XP_036587690.1 wsc domain-containing protein [Colletotrichum truncatum]KAF6780677.1 wsc domain-containing protein [Colletotrichum truncatum]KAF6798632.1 wsc domain-containing protein [Colletotrichum truncatum]
MLSFSVHNKNLISWDLSPLVYLPRSSHSLNTVTHSNMRSTTVAALMALAGLAQSTAVVSSSEDTCTETEHSTTPSVSSESQAYPVHTGTGLTTLTRITNSTGIWGPTGGPVTPPATLTSTYTATITHTITSCPPGVKPCAIGSVTTVVTTVTTTYCPETPPPVPCHNGKCDTPPDCNGEHCPRPNPPGKPPHPPANPPQKPPVDGKPPHPEPPHETKPGSPEHTPSYPPQKPPVKPPHHPPAEPSQKPSEDSPQPPAKTPGHPDEPTPVHPSPSAKKPTHSVVVAGASKEASKYITLALGVLGGAVFLL